MELKLLLSPLKVIFVVPRKALLQRPMPLASNPGIN